MVLISFVMSSDQGIGQNLPKSLEPTGKYINLPVPVAKECGTHRFGLRLRTHEALRRSRLSSSAGIRRVRDTAAEEGETRCFVQRWRSRRAQRVYSLKLYEALRRWRRRSSAGVGGVRDTADRVLAAAARGSTRWSRAIQVSRLQTRRNAKAAARGTESQRVGRRNSPAAGNRVRVLARLVPGCRRTALPELLHETADYIAALEMQVRAMTALAEILADSQPSDRLTSACISR